MKRKIVLINEELCNGCGLCAASCHEGAIQMVNGKAKLMSESYCDGLGACLPSCPTGAIRIEEREADVFDEKAVERHLAEQKTKAAQQPEKPACGCPGSQARSIERTPAPQKEMAEPADNQSELMQWPCQIQLVPPNAPYLDGADLLIASDCTAFANANVHKNWMRGRITLIGCPKLDEVDYAEKLQQIFSLNDIRSVTVLRMSVPCCGGIVNAVKRAMLAAGAMIPWQIVTVDTNGNVLG